MLLHLVSRKASGPDTEVVPRDPVAVRCAMILDSLDIGQERFGAATGWTIKPEGACKGDVCVPLPSGPFDVRSTAERLRMALVHDESAGLWAIGPAALGDRALTTAEAPELVLNDLDGSEFRLSSLRGQKVVIVSWAPY